MAVDTFGFQRNFPFPYPKFGFLYYIEELIPQSEPERKEDMIQQESKWTLDEIPSFPLPLEAKDQTISLINLDHSPVINIINEDIQRAPTQMDTINAIPVSSQEETSQTQVYSPGQNACRSDVVKKSIIRGVKRHFVQILANGNPLINTLKNSEGQKCLQAIEKVTSSSPTNYLTNFFLVLSLKLLAQLQFSALPANSHSSTTPLLPTPVQILLLRPTPAHLLRAQNSPVLYDPEHSHEEEILHPLCKNLLQYLIRCVSQVLKQEDHTTVKDEGIQGHFQEIFG